MAAPAIFLGGGAGAGDFASTVAGQWSGGGGAGGSPAAGDSIVMAGTAPPLTANQNAYAAVSITGFSSKGWRGDSGTTAISLLVTSGTDTERIQLGLLGGPVVLTGTFHAPIEVYECKNLILQTITQTSYSLYGATYSIVAGRSGTINAASTATLDGLIQTDGINIICQTALSASGNHFFRGGSHYLSAAQTNGVIVLDAGAEFRIYGSVGAATVRVGRGCVLELDTTGTIGVVEVEPGGLVLPGRSGLGQATITTLYRHPGSRVVLASGGSTILVTTDTRVGYA